MFRLLFKITIFVAISLLVVSCMPSTEVSVIPFNSRIDVFTSPESVQRPYTEIALIKADDRGNYESEQELIAKILIEAESLGADAVILLNEGTVKKETTTYGWYRPSFGSYFGRRNNYKRRGSYHYPRYTYYTDTSRIMSATAIRYNDVAPSNNLYPPNTDAPQPNNY